MTYADRWQFWSWRGATNPDATELTAYVQSGFDPSAFDRAIEHPFHSILDELIADYIAVVAATGWYRAESFLRSLGLDTPAGCRADGRIHSYRGTPPLSDEAFAILQRVVRDAAWQLEAFDDEHRVSEWGAIEATRLIVAIAATGLEGLASDDGCDQLDDALAELRT